MQVTGMLYGSRMLQFVGFPAAEVLGSDASEDEIKALIERHGSVFIKPVFKGGVGKKGKAGLLGRAKDLKTALKEKERLYFVEHRHGNQVAKANGVTFEGAVPAEHEVYFSLTDSTHFRAPTMTLTHHGGMDIEELDKSQVAQVPFDPLTGFKAFVVANALSNLKAPKEIISPLVQHLPKLWELFHDYGMKTLELNPIRMRPDRGSAFNSLNICLQWTIPISSTRSISCEPTRAKATFTSSTPRGPFWRPPSAAAPTRWSPSFSATMRSSRRTSAAIRPTPR